MQKTYLSILFLVFTLISLNQSFGQCVIIDTKGCEKISYKIDINKNTTEMVIDSCGKITETIKLSYNAQKLCTGIEMSAGTTKFTHDVNKKLTKAIMDANGTPITNTFQYISNNLSKIVTKMDMMGFKMEVNTKFIYKGNNISKIEVFENLSQKKIVAIDAIVYDNVPVKTNYDFVNKGIKYLTLGFYTGMGNFNSLVEGSDKQIKSYLLYDNNTCETPIKVENVYEYGDKPYPISVIIKKTCEGNTTSEKHLMAIECK